MANPRLQTRVNRGTKDRVEEFKEEAGEPTESDAVRRLVVRGLEAEQSPPGDTLTSVAWASLALSLAAYYFGAELIAGTVAVSAAGLFLYAAHKRNSP